MEWDSKWSRHRLKGLAIPPRGRRRSLWKVYRRSREQTWPAALLSEGDTQNADEFAARDNRSEATTLRSDAFARAIVAKREKGSFSPKGRSKNDLSFAFLSPFLFFFFFLKNTRRTLNVRRGAARRDSKCADCICWCQWPPIDSTLSEAQTRPSRSHPLVPTLSFPLSRPRSLSLFLSLFPFTALFRPRSPSRFLAFDHPRCAPNGPLPSRSLTRLYMRDIPR